MLLFPIAVARSPCPLLASSAQGECLWDQCRPHFGRHWEDQMNRVWLHGLAVCLFAVVTLGTIRDGYAQNAAGTWPHTIATPNASVAVYQPQAIAWPNHEKLTARAALAITRQGDKTPIVGTVEIALATRVDAATGDVVLSDPQLLATHFPSLDTAQAAQLEEHIRTGLLPGIDTKRIA